MASLSISQAPSCCGRWWRSRSRKRTSFHPGWAPCAGRRPWGRQDRVGRRRCREDNSLRVPGIASAFATGWRATRPSFQAKREKVARGERPVLAPRACRPPGAGHEHRLRARIAKCCSSRCRARPGRPPLLFCSSPSRNHPCLSNDCTPVPTVAFVNWAWWQYRRASDLESGE